MKQQDIAALVELPPRGRALKMLDLGAELNKIRPRAEPKPGALPAFLKRESVTASPAAIALNTLHGLRGLRLEGGAGLRATGRSLATRAGEVTDFVFTPQARKAAARRAMDRAKDRSVRDLALRQLALGMLDNEPVTRTCAAYAYWQATGAKDVAVPILDNAIHSDDPEEQILAAHCMAHVAPGRVGALLEARPRGDEHQVRQR